MIYGIIFFISLILSIALSYKYADKWCLVGKDDDETIDEIEAVNSRIFQELKENPSSIENYAIHAEIKDGKIISVSTETSRTRKRLFLDEHDTIQALTTYKAFSLRGARIFLGVIFFITIATAFLFCDAMYEVWLAMQACM